MTASIDSDRPRSGNELFEQKLATMTRSLYENALDRGIAGSTIEFQLSLWDELRGVMSDERAFASTGSTLSTDGRGTDMFLSRDV